MMEWVTNFGIAAAALLAALKIKDLFTPSSKPLRAEIEFGPFLFLNSILENVKDFRSRLSVSSLTKLADLSEIIRADDPKRVDSAIRQTITNISEKLRGECPTIPFEVKYLKGIYICEIINKGNTALSDIRLYVPEPEFSLIRRDGQEPIFEVVKDFLTIPSLHPHESVKVVVWTSSSPSDTWSERITLTHSAGIGTVTRKLSQRGAIDAAFRWFIAACAVMVLSSFLVVAKYASRIGRERDDQPKIERQEIEQDRKGEKISPPSVKAANAESSDEIASGQSDELTPADREKLRKENEMNATRSLRQGESRSPSHIPSE